MQNDFSFYEENNPHRQEKNSGIALGFVEQVFPKERVCKVRTFGHSGGLGDNVINRCQWINMDSNPEGDEATSIPRRNSVGIVFYIGGQPFLFGFFKPLSKNGSAAQGNEPINLQEGDKVISTVAGNRITVKSNGIVELHSGEALRRIQMPSENKLIEICSKYDLRADGGAILWKSEDSKTVCQSEFRRDLVRSIVVTEEKGAVDEKTALKTCVGPANPVAIGTLSSLYEHSVDIDGTTNLKVGPAGNVAVKVSPSGSASVEVNKTTKLDISESGDVTVKTTGATVGISSSGEVTVKALGQVSISGGGLAATELPLTYPTTVSHFTGLPLSPGSQNVKLSK